MKAKFRLDQKDIEEAVRRFVKEERGVDVKTVYLQHYQADSRDPRESSYFYAEVSE